MKLPLDELSSAHLVAIEIPPVALKGFEHDLLHLVAKIRAIGPHVAIIVSKVSDGRPNKLCGFKGGTDWTIDLSKSRRHAHAGRETRVRDVTFRFYLELRTLWS